MADSRGPVVVVGAHCAGLRLRVDRIPGEGETVLGWDYDEPVDGGKATNQAVAASRLGAPVRLVTVLGDDERAERALAMLAVEGVDCTHVTRAHGPTDVGFLILPTTAVPAIVSAVDRSRELDGHRVAAASAACEDASVVVCQLEAPVEAAITAFGLARDSGAQTILNPAPAQDLPPELTALTDILIPNLSEAVELCGVAGTPEELALELLHRTGVKTVIVTAGRDGAFVVTGDEPVQSFPAPGVEAVDTTGAGDAFVGALAAGIGEGQPLTVAVAVAVQVASISVTRPDSIPSYPHRSELPILDTTGAGA